MSASYRKDRALSIAICKAPPNLSREAFENKFTSIVDTLVALPISQKKYLKFDLIFQTELGNEQLKALGFPEAPPSVWLTVECATVADFFEIFEDPAFAQVVQEGKNDLYGNQPTVNAFLADVEIRIDRPASSRTLLVGAMQLTENLSVDEFHHRLGNSADKLVSLPIAQRVIVKYSVWRPNNAIDTHLQAMGFSTPESGAVIMIETEHDTMLEGLMHSETEQYVLDAKRELNIHIGSSFFVGNVVNKISK
ncbi:hypothetical protein MSAN_01073200 [Mycena sanguinolenta]|uniref:Uncharacterized protein n=1 Tax=Mycena sanguinolenta TaxID=230812 RepID=A0A8H6YN21_9AGAR|nr:hypothetical protein MSAN_01073200 [Mycena sanguinolenta]